jgi:tRNA A37 N6-isopentenylltransferase MiaA
MPFLIKQKVEEKRRVHRNWHRLRIPESRRLINTATQELKQLLNNNTNDCIQTFLQGLTLTESADYFLSMATKKIKQVNKPSPQLWKSQGTWVRNKVEKAHAFAEHLAKVSQQHLPISWKPLTNSNHQSTALKDQKFKKSLTA